MLVKKFIEGPFLSEIRSMVFYEDKEGNIKVHAYLGFQLICLAIEFLGACLDQYERRLEVISITTIFPMNNK